MFGIGKKKQPQIEEVSEQAVTKAEMVGQKVHVNPTASVSLARLKGRQKRIQKFIDDYIGDPNADKISTMRDALRRLDLQIKLHEGDY